MTALLVILFLPLVAFYLMASVATWKLRHRARRASPLNEAQRLMASLHRTNT